MKRLFPTIAAGALALALVAGGLKIRAVARDIRRQSAIDEVRPADVIVVLGAAEYRGRPSPVLQARLNHALVLYLQGLAPRILTTGGKGGDSTYSEGEVAHAYLSRHGVPSEAILVESEGDSTARSIAGAAEIMRLMNLKSCIVVSDGYHIYRVKKMLEGMGMKAYGSPRPAGPPAEGWREEWVYTRQAIAYELWRIGIPI
ncbi:MAG: YdcF family protein [Bryobacterales bacterium]|nr:YdcF family protein [Bryobacterales bacterium]MBV9398252.1 YdcF family protein [Bryobacterales bacterium]